MKKLLFLVFFLSVSFAYSQHLINPDTLWTYGPLEGGFSSYPAVHPNGNILIGDTRKEDVVELNGMTGQIIRRIPITIGDHPHFKWIEVSPDSKLLIIAGKIIDYQTGGKIDTIPEGAYQKFLPLDNNKIVMVNKNKIITYDYVKHIKTEVPYTNSQYIDATALEVSHDGRYFALACIQFEPDNYRTHLYLYDAQSMKLIREMEDVPSEGRRIEFIQFSENSKYVGYGHVTAGTFKATIFTVDQPYKKWEFSNWKMPGYGMNSVGFIGDEYAFLSSIGSPVFSIIWDLEKDLPVYHTEKYGTYYPVYNKYTNSIIVGDNYTGSKVALNIDAIVSVAQDISQDNIKLIFNYQNEILGIKNLPQDDSLTEVSIFNITGKIIYKSVLPITDRSLQIRIDLLSGIYILQMQTGDKQYSQKFIVSE